MSLAAAKSVAQPITIPTPQDLKRFSSSSSSSSVGSDSHQQTNSPTAASNADELPPLSPVFAPSSPTSWQKRKQHRRNSTRDRTMS
ncbi:hypothetical protein HK102_005077, partial [Quaeritorhiza haematococci]